MSPRTRCPESARCQSNSVASRRSTDSRGLRWEVSIWAQSLSVPTSGRRTELDRWTGTQDLVGPFVHDLGRARQSRGGRTKRRELVTTSAGGLGEDLLAQDVGMSGVLSEFSQHLEVERPHRAFASAIDGVVQLQCRHGGS